MPYWPAIRRLLGRAIEPCTAGYYAQESTGLPETVGKLTRKGQVTGPAPTRQALGLEEGDRVEFMLAAGEARLKRRTGYVERTRGAVTSGAPAPSAARLRAEAEAALAEGAAERGGVG